MIFDKHRPPLDWKSAVWLPVWLIGLGVISWQGQYSGGAVAAPVNTNNIPFWWDMVVVAGFSLAIYYWAQFPKLPKDEMAKPLSLPAGVRPPQPPPPPPPPPPKPPPGPL